MVRRHSDWEQDLARKLRKANFAREFILALVGEGDSVQTALGSVIRQIGVKEFSEKVGMDSSNVLRAIHPRHNPTQETLDRLLKPFGLRLTLAQNPRSKSRAA